MEAVIETLYGIPVLGLFFQFFGYLLETLPRLSPIALTAAAPVAYGALCGVMNERSGVVNIGIEGTMLSAAFSGFLAAFFLDPMIGSGAALGAGIVAAVLTAMAVSLLHAWLSVSIRADQIISGTIINIGAFGLTGYLYALIVTGQSQAGAGTFGRFDAPEWLVELPLIGWLFQMFLRQGPITMTLILFVIGLQVMLFRSRWGLRTRAVGEHPKAADTVGIDVIRLRYRNVVIGGAFAGLGGAVLTLEQAGSFTPGMTNGMGFIALAAVIFGRWTPIGAFGAAILFQVSAALGRQIGIRPPDGQLGEILTAIPNQFYAALPYLVTLVILAGVVGRSIPPAAVGEPYEKEKRATT